MAQFRGHEFAAPYDIPNTYIADLLSHWLAALVTPRGAKKIPFAYEFLILSYIRNRKTVAGG